MFSQLQLLVLQLFLFVLLLPRKIHDHLVEDHQLKFLLHEQKCLDLFLHR